MNDKIFLTSKISESYSLVLQFLSEHILEKVEIELYHTITIRGYIDSIEREIISWNVKTENILKINQKINKLLQLFYFKVAKFYAESKDYIFELKWEEHEEDSDFDKPYIERKYKN